MSLSNLTQLPSEKTLALILKITAIIFFFCSFVAEVSPVRCQPLESVNSQAEGKEVRELTESPTSQKPLSTSEELLIHLGPLLDDF